MASKEEYENLHNWLGARIGELKGKDEEDVQLPLVKAKLIYEFMALWLAE